MTIERLKKIGGSALMPIALMAHAELIREGHTDGLSHGFSIDAEVIFAKDEAGDVMGLLVWKVYEEEPDRAWISMSWVAPAARRRGVYRALYAALIEDCKERKVKLVESYVFAGNKAMEACALELGRKPNRTIYAGDVQ